MLRSYDLASSRAAVLAALSSLTLACGDDNASADGADSSTSEGGSTTVTSTSSQTTVATATSATVTSADTSDTSDSSSSESGGMPPATCGPSMLPGALDAGAWDERFTLAGLTGRDGYRPVAYDIAADLDGAVLVGGYFRWGDGAAMEGIARHDGTQWSMLPGWEGLAPSGFSAIAVGPAGELVGATADLAQQGDGEIWLDTGSGPTLIGNHTGAFRRFAWIDGVLWGVGNFQLEGGTATGFALWDGDAWSPAPGGDPDGPVFEIVRAPDGDVIVGGEFTEIGGVAAQRVARLEAGTWTALDLPESARVLALEFDDEDTLWAGGLFALAPESLPSSSLARWTGSAWELAAGGVAAGEATGVVSDLQLVDGAMVVVGCFDRVGGGQDDPAGEPAADIARLVDGAWEPLGDGPGTVGSAWFDDLLCGYEPDPNAVFSMAVQRVHRGGEQLWLGGAFGGIDHVASRSVARFVDETWQAAGTHGLGVSGTIAQLAHGGEACDVYGLAAATHAGGMQLDAAVARWDAVAGWQSASPAAPEGRSCGELEVTAEGDPVIGCIWYGDDFVGHGEVHVLVDGVWESIGELPGAVHDLAVAPDGTLWIAGGEATGWLARWNGGAPTVVEDGFDGLVLAIAIAQYDGAGHDVVVGGAFTNVGGLAAQRIARFDGEDWQALGDGLVATPSAIEATADTVWAASYDEGVDGRLVLGRFDGSAWEELGTPAHGLPAPFGFSSHTFTRLRALDEGLVAVGYVWPDTGGRNAFFFDGDQFTPIGDGVAAISVDDVLVTDDALLLGGSIAEVGDGESLRSSVGFARFAW